MPGRWIIAERVSMRASRATRWMAPHCIGTSLWPASGFNPCADVVGMRVFARARTNSGNVAVAWHTGNFLLLPAAPFEPTSVNCFNVVCRPGQRQSIP